MPTLFDLKGSYALDTWPQDWAYFSSLLYIFKNHDNIAFIDIKNEPDLDMANYDPGLIEAWLRTMIGLARDQAPEHAYTVGWSSAEAALILIEQVDILSYHDLCASCRNSRSFDDGSAGSAGQASSYHRNWPDILAGHSHPCRIQPQSASPRPTAAPRGLERF